MQHKNVHLVLIFYLSFELILENSDLLKVLHKYFFLFRQHYFFLTANKNASSSEKVFYY